MNYLLSCTLLLPFVSSLILGLLINMKKYQNETFYSKFTCAVFFLNILSFSCLLVSNLSQDMHELLQSPDHPSSWLFALVADTYSTILVVFYCVLILLISVFSRRYLHRDPGYFRFYFFLNVFGAGVQTVLMASSLSLLMIGWEAVGIASAMLISFFFERSKPVEHGLRAFFTYRFCDVGFVFTLLLLHSANLSPTFNFNFTNSWQTLALPSDPMIALLVGLGLVLAAAGKSAQLPFSGWLPRAMEGPTPSSAIFYGAISVHLGAFLLLRCAPLIEQSLLLKTIIIAIALATALHSTLTGRVQTDIKSSLAYASLTQVSVIWIEIALGFYTLALVHMIGHAALRSLQILKSPSALHDHQHLEEALGSQIPSKAQHIETLIPMPLQRWLYRHSLDRGFAEAIIFNWVFRPIKKLLHHIEWLDQKWISLINRTSNNPKA
jgi:NADH-quinone oxidoreductase subunit L